MGPYRGSTWLGAWYVENPQNVPFSATFLQQLLEPPAPPPPSTALSVLHPSFPSKPSERGQSLINSEQLVFVLCVEWAREAQGRACEPALFPPPHSRAGGLQLPARALQGLAEEAIEGVMNGCWFRESGRCASPGIQIQREINTGSDQLEEDG